MYRKPEHWADPANKLFPWQVGFTAPPRDFDAARTDFLRMAPEGVGERRPTGVGAGPRIPVAPNQATRAPSRKRGSVPFRIR